MRSCGCVYARQACRRCSWETAQTIMLPSIFVEQRSCCVRALLCLCPTPHLGRVYLSEVFFRAAKPTQFSNKMINYLFL